MRGSAGIDGVGVLKLSGDVDLAAVKAIMAKAEECLSARPAVLRIDLGSVSFMDSDLVLSDVPARVMRVLNISGLDRVFEIEEPKGSSD